MTLVHTMGTNHALGSKYDGKGYQTDPVARPRSLQTPAPGLLEPAEAATVPLEPGRSKYGPKHERQGKPRYVKTCSTPNRLYQHDPCTTESDTPTVTSSQQSQAQHRLRRKKEREFSGQQASAGNQTSAHPTNHTHGCRQSACDGNPLLPSEDAGERAARLPCWARVCVLGMGTAQQAPSCNCWPLAPCIARPHWCKCPCAIPPTILVQLKCAFKVARGQGYTGVLQVQNAACVPGP